MFNFKRVFSKTKVLSRTATRFFSNNQNGPNTESFARTANLAILGVGTAGLGYMFWKSMSRDRATYQSPSLPFQQLQTMGAPPAAYSRPQVTKYNPVVQGRVQNALAYFGAGIGLTGLSISLFRYTSLAYVHPLLLFIPTIAAMIGTFYFNYHTQAPMKHLFWGSFCALEGLALSPLINMAGMPIVFNALVATGAMMGLLGAYAYNTPTSDFLSWRGGLSMGLCALIGVSLVNMFWPSPLLTSLSLYGGLLLFGGFVLYDTHKLLHNAQMKASWDPINESISIYLDAIIIFQKLLIIFSSNKKK